MSDQIDPEDLYKAAYRETQGQPVDAEPRRPIVAAQQDGGLVDKLNKRALALRGLVKQTATTKYDADLSEEAADRIEALEAWKVEAMEVLREVVTHLGDIEDGNGDPAPEIQAARRLVEKGDRR